jgi:hypothetical protein
LFPFLYTPVPVNVTVNGLINVLLNPFQLPSPPLNVGNSVFNIVFSLSATPSGLILDEETGRITGTPTSSGKLQADAVATDLYTNASVVVARVTFDIRVCSPTQCERGGFCVAPYTSAACDCSTATGTGPLCDHTITVASSGQDAGEIVGIVLSVLLGSFLLTMGAYQIYLRFDNRKTFHIFISYRVATDVKLAQHIYRQLQGRFLSTGHRIRYSASSNCSINFFHMYTYFG